MLFSDLIKRVNRAKQNVQGLVVDTDTLEYNQFLAESASSFLDEANFCYAVEATATVSAPEVVLRTQFTPPLKTIDRIEYRRANGEAWTLLTDINGNPSAEAIDIAMTGKDATSVAGVPTTFVRTSVSTIRLIPDPPANLQLLAWGIRVFIFDPTAMSADMQVPQEFERGLVSYCLCELLEGVMSEAAVALYSLHKPIADLAVAEASIQNANARRLSRGVRFKNRRRNVVTLR